MKEFDIGYLAAMIDRSGYIGIHPTRDKLTTIILRMRPEVSITVKKDSIANHLQHILSKDGIEFRVRERFNHKNGISYSVYTITVINLDSLKTLVDVVGKRVKEKERMEALSNFMHAHFHAKPKVKIKEKEKFTEALYELNRQKKRLAD